MSDRNKKERERLRQKRLNPAYIEPERAANRARMQARRGNRKTGYVAMERAKKWWKR